MQTITIKPATVDDATAIADLSSSLGYPASVPVTIQRIECVSDSPSDVLLVAVADDGRTVAWIQGHHAFLIESGPRVEIVGLVVADGYRRRGIGRRLVHEIERWACERGAAAIVVRSNIARQESHAFYPAAGYTTTKTQHVYRKQL